MSTSTGINSVIRNAKFDLELYHIDGFDVRCGLVDSIGSDFALCVSCSQIVFNNGESCPGIVISTNDVAHLFAKYGMPFTASLVSFAIAHEMGHIKYWNEFGASNDGTLVTDPKAEVYADRYAITQLHVPMGVYRTYMHVFGRMIRESNKKNMNSLLIRGILYLYNDVLLKSRTNHTVKSVDFSSAMNVERTSEPYYKLARSIVKKSI